MMSLNWDMKPAGVSFRLHLLLLGFWVLLTLSQGFQGRPSWRYISSEVVIPRKETLRGKGLQVPGQLSYTLRFGGQKHVIHLHRKKLLWPRHLLLMTQDNQGALQMDYPFFPEDCYYLGHLEEIPYSMVTVNTCYGGLDGIMKLDNFAYEIKPLKVSLKFEHVVSQILVDSSTVEPVYNLESKDLFFNANITAAPRFSSKNYASHSAAIRGHVQGSRSIYGMSNNVTQASIYLIQIFNFVDSFLQSLYLRFYIYMITIYNNGDPVQINTIVPGGPFHNYYVQNIYNAFKPDSSILVNKDSPEDTEADPVSRSICLNTNLLFVGQKGRPTVEVAISASSRIGRSIGLNFDHIYYCICQRRSTCIMFRHPFMTDSFSNCSIVQLQEIMGTPGNMDCVFRQSREYINKTISFVRCGNDFVEENEQCDCGSFKSCYSNECCETNCQLTEESICDKGMCCTNCTYSPSGTLCRPIQNICDLPEYCTGHRITCPEDIYLQDGTPCSEEGYCFQGNCSDRNIQCKEVFGLSADAGATQCYDINLERYRFGHCSREDTSLLYNACVGENKMCGRLQCANVTNLPRLQDHVSFHHSLISGHLCFGLDEHRGTDSNDAGRVRDGSLCSQGKYCIESACRGLVTSLGYDCTPQKCNFRGTCNNKKNCHCHIGWEPPDCSAQGSGGSLNSGPPPKVVRKVIQSQYPVFYLRVVCGRLYVFIATMLYGAAASLKSLKIIRSRPGLYTAPPAQA